ncbi:hypothetical protein SDC9_210234 [bioreactor metagenome]|uniref:DUF1273 domain-containing protein n=1 Tax=bioreactor metagenome TaxID=1076179 RepID=A0A645JFL2_9ZZZZ
MCGGAIGFDTLAAKVVIELRKTNPQIKLILVQPCNNQDEFWSLEQKGDYALISLMADKVLYANNEYHDGCMRYRSRRLVNHSVVCLCYCKRIKSGTSYTVNYAKERACEIINLAE